MYLSLFCVVGEGLLCLGSKRKRKGRGERGKEGQKIRGKKEEGGLGGEKGRGRELPSPGGVLNLSLVRGCRPDLETLTLFMTKSSRLTDGLHKMK